jgi:acyl carrier protein
MSTTLERVKRLFVNKFDFNIEKLQPTTTLEELGLDSLDKVELMFDIEDEFKIRIPDEEYQKLKVTTIQEVADAIDTFLSEQILSSSNQAIINQT